MKTKELPYKTIKEMEIYVINKALDKAHTKKAAAVLLGITEKTLYNKILTYGI
jgi:transcriptional regulator with PAS, ATPase and Fis domain